MKAQKYIGYQISLAAIILINFFAINGDTIAQSHAATKSVNLPPVQRVTARWTFTGQLGNARLGHTETLLPNGKVLVAGGTSLDAENPFNTAELYDTISGTWSRTGRLNEGRAFHTATLLPDGKVLVAAGSTYFNNLSVTRSAELYDPVTGRWSYTGNLSVGRALHTATLLPNGKVLVAGGQGGLFSGDPTNSANIYDPATGIWSVTGNLNNGGYAQTATLLNNGKVLFTGNGGAAELYDPTTATWTYTGHLNAGRAYHSAVLLLNGAVLVAGGRIGFGAPINSAELYDPGTEVWSNTGNLNTARDLFTATLLLNCQVLVAGGVGGGLLDSSELYDLATNSTSHSVADFDGDGKSDVSVFRPSNGVWYLQQSTAGFNAVPFGLSTDRLAPADYDGDGKTDIAVYRSGMWFLLRSTLGFTSVVLGDPLDNPQPADFDGDGKSELAVFRPSNGTWYVLNLVNYQSNAFQFGNSTDKPVVGDYDGDGKADYAVYRIGTWYLQRSSLGFLSVAFGVSTDKPVVGDYDGDGKADVAVYRPSEGTWYLQQSTSGFKAVQFGISTDLPAPADYDGDGKMDIAVFRDGNWYILQSSNGQFTIQLFGLIGDVPVAGANVP